MFTNLNDLKDRISVVDVISHFIKLKRVGSNLEACCPFHNEKTPSFKVHKSKNTWRCFGGCQTSGDAIDFVVRYRNCSFIQAVEEIASIYSFTLEKESKEIIRPVPRIEKISKEFIDNFEKKRKITNNTLSKFGISEGFEWMPKAKKEVKVLCFNYVKDGELVNIKFRGANKDMKLAKDAELVFYNLDSIADTEECCIVEGEIDCLSLYEAGINYGISTPNGANTNFKYIDNCYDYFLNKNKIIIAVDNDEPGRKLKEELINRFGRDRCLIAEFPTDCKDANDVLVKHGAEVLKRCIEDAKQINIAGIVPHNERKDALFSLYKNGVPVGTAAGIFGLDSYIRFQGGLVTVITGAPGSGKSEFLDYIIASLAINENWRFGIFSFENQPTCLHDQKIAEKMIGKAFSFRKDVSQRISEKELELTFDTLDDRFKTIDKTQADISIDGILEKTKELIYRYGIKGIVIDPFNKVHHKTSNMYDPSYINEFMNKVTNFAVSWNIHVFLVAHPSKLLKDKQTGKIEVPNLYSISGGANFYNQMDNGIVINRDRQTNIVDVIIGKMRFHEQGKEGFVSYSFNTFTRQYTFHTSSDPILPKPRVEYKQSFIDNITGNDYLDSLGEDELPFPISN
jgi:twinkle protein